MTEIILVAAAVALVAVTGAVQWRRVLGRRLSYVNVADGRKMIVTLGVPAADLTRTLAAKQNVGPQEVLRRGLMLINLFTNLEPGMDLVILDRETGKAERLRPMWDPVP